MSLELAMVTRPWLRQPAELPPVHRRRQLAVCESCQDFFPPVFSIIIQETLKRLQGLVTFQYLGSL